MRLQRVTNKVLCTQIAEPLWDWVRPSESKNIDTERLQIFRDLDSEDEKQKTLLKECHILVVETLIVYSKGKKKEKPDEDSVTEDESTPKKNKRKVTPVMPYGMAASWSTEAFKEVPLPFFSATIATLYPFVTMDKSEWAEKAATFYYPMTRLWPLKEVKRRIHFYNRFLRMRNVIFGTYEDAGGEYHPESDSDDDETVDGKSPDLWDTDSHDDVFV